MKTIDSRGFSHLLIPILVFVMLGVIGGIYFLNRSNAATPPATTTSSAITPALYRGQTIRLCQKQWPTFCIKGNGAGNPITIDVSNYASWTVLTGGYNNSYYEFRNSSGNCLASNGSYAATLISGGCTGIGSELWSLYTATPLRLQNYATGGVLGVSCPDSIVYVTEKVYTKAPQANFCAAWAN